MSCTNVMLQCLDRDSRCIFILGTMFRIDSRIAADILEITPETYRKRLSRIREKMAAFLDEYCGLSGKGMCNCKKRIHYAAATHRLNPKNLEYHMLEQGGSGMIQRCKDAMEKIDDLSIIFADMPVYRTSPEVKTFVSEFLDSDVFQTVADA